MTTSSTNPVQRGPVVLAIHGGEVGVAPIVLARRLAMRIGVPLEVVTVTNLVRIWALEDGIRMITAPVTADLSPVQEELVKLRLQDACGDHPWALTVLHGQPPDEISRFAEEKRATMIVIAMSPRRSRRLGATSRRALQLLRRVSCPVLAVAPEQHGLPETIVAAIDFGPASVRAAQAALLLLDDAGRLILAHASLLPSRVEGKRDHSDAREWAEIAERYQRLLEELRPYAPQGAALEVRQLEGEAGPALLQLADLVEADLVTVGAHSQNVVQHLVVGSVATTILRGAPCSALATFDPAAVERVRLELRMSDTALTKVSDDWPAVLHAASVRNAGRGVRLEEDDPALGAQVQARGFTLTGIDFDPEDQRVDIMLSREGSDAAHLTRTIEDVASVGINSTPDGRDRAIKIDHGRSSTLVLFEG